ncbi:peptide ABC transporter permease [Candidatus Epulonipiscium fishelsonii]|uniref:Peptide ABC transporter permease n=1 Tax=Candidatus Epulonipiscium fishelsonii TaxID=77094 RepID=A0ACC8XCV6_9FIRM|nr:peptide ABC transporter permease [Epulopiscium sp. SCG-B11WGA-EpuloA1]ONI41781.1 peptide ABC transporter permease [Epulopiscium sp. SCG-B05WGA-EpuloA1]
MNRRKSIIIILFLCISILILLATAGIYITEEHYAVNFANKNSPPSFDHIFGTDFMGRDMFYRTLEGISISMWIGILATAVSSIMALIIGFFAGMLGKKIDAFITWTIDLLMSIPHLLLLVLICIATGGGTKGITVAIMLTHWTILARIVRTEVMVIKTSEYIQTSKRMGKSSLFITIKHIMPHIIPQLIIGSILLFPHAIMHEASITFLGFGIPKEIPAIGAILSESMNYLTSGMWWLSVLPGLTLLFVVILFEVVGDNLQRLIDPTSVQE